MISRLMSTVGCLAMLGAGLVLSPAPAEAAGSFFMTGTFEANNGASRRRSIDGFQSTVSTTSASGMGAVAIQAGAFSETGNPDSGKLIFANAGCPATPGGILCAIQNATGGWQVYPGFPTFAQNASTYTEVNAAGTFGPGSGPGAFQFCPLVTNTLNGPGPLPSCPGTTTAMGGLIGVQPLANDIQGIVTYSGGGGFGGTMAVTRDVMVEVTTLADTSPLGYQFDYEHRTFPWIAGAGFAFTTSIQPTTGVQTRNAVLGPFSSIATPGGVVTTGGLTTMQTGATGPAAPGNPVASSIFTGFPWTTGTVRIAEDGCAALGQCPTAYNPYFFRQYTVMGTDARGPDGQGTLSLVAGGIFQNRSVYGTSEFNTLDLTMTLPEPGTALGIASGIALMLGLARRRS